MTCDGINEVADLTASGGSHYCVGGKVNRVEDVAECFVGDSWEESEVTIGDPFQAGVRIQTCDRGSIDER